MNAPKPLANRFRFERHLRGSSRGASWLATDGQTGQSVVVAWLPQARALGLKPVLGLAHPHVARILWMSEHPDRAELPADGETGDGWLVVAEHVPGRTLHQRMEGGRLSLPRAIQTVTRLARALRAIHDKGGFHGALSPRSVIVTRAELGVAPVLTSLLAPPNGAYCSPERVTGGGPSATDDAWALVATLYSVLTGRPPFAGESRKELARMILAGRAVQISAFGTDDADLQRIVDRGLAPKAAERLTSVGAIEAELLAWSRQHGADGPPPRSETPPPSRFSTQAPPSVSDEEIVQAVLNPAHPDANRSVSTYALPAQGDHGRELEDEGASSEGSPDIEVGRPSLDDHADVLVALASQPPPRVDAEEDDSDIDSDAPTGVMASPLEAYEALLAAARPPDRDPVTEPRLTPARTAPSDAPAPTAEAARRDQEPEPERAAVVVSTTPGATASPALATAAHAGPAVVPAAAPTRSASRSTVPYVAAGVAVLIGGLVVAVMGLRGPDAERPTSVSTAAALATPAPTRTARAPAPPAPAPAIAAASTPPATAASTPPATPASAASAEAPVAPTPTAAPPIAPPANLGACVAAQFPADTFRSTEGFDVVCDEADPRKIQAKLYSKIVAAGVGRLTDGMRLWSRMEWYQLAVVATARTACCPGAPALELPATETCAPLATALSEIGSAVWLGSAVAEKTEAFHQAVACLFDKQAPRPFRHKRRADSANRAAFEELLASRAGHRAVGP